MRAGSRDDGIRVSATVVVGIKPRWSSILDARG